MVRSSVDDLLLDDTQNELLQLRARLAELTRALANREVIGQAVGILIATVPCTPDDGFQALVRESQHTNRKLCDIARDLVSAHSPTPPSPN